MLHLKHNPLTKIVSRSVFYFLLLTIFSASTVLAQVSAPTLTNCDIKDIIQEHAAYDTCAGSSTDCSENGGGDNLVGSDNAEKAFNYFTQTRGLSDIAAAGLVGNMQQESGPSLSTTAGSPSGPYGIVQWLGGRLTNLQKFADADRQNRPISDLSLQLDFAWKELTTAYKSTTLTPLKSASNPDESAKIVFDDYERPGDSSLPDRQANAWKLYKQYGSGNTGSGGDSSGADCSSQTTGLVWPFATKSTSQYNRVDQGWDIQDGAKAAIYAIAPGTLHLSNPNPGGFGNDYPYETLDDAIGGPSKTVYYGHVHLISSLNGRHVDAGQLIAYANVSDGENGSNAPPGWLEVGFSRPGTGAPVNHCTATSTTNCLPTPAGQKMKDLLLDAKPAPKG